MDRQAGRGGARGRSDQALPPYLAARKARTGPRHRNEDGLGHPREALCLAVATHHRPSAFRRRRRCSGRGGPSGRPAGGNSLRDGAPGDRALDRGRQDRARHEREEHPGRHADLRRRPADRVDRAPVSKPTRSARPRVLRSRRGVRPGPLGQSAGAGGEPPATAVATNEYRLLVGFFRAAHAPDPGSGAGE